jgi:hypothetical protein
LFVLFKFPEHFHKIAFTIFLKLWINVLIQ